ncbi:hypothetical protein N9988_00165 [bacterium]|jgi:hypothetical protein|nr:hypothetical protein [bacterium]
MEKYISIPNVDSSGPNVLISITNIFAARRNNDTSLNIVHVNKATQININHDSAQGFEMIEWLIANIIRANSHKSMITEVSDPPFNITGFYFG